MRPAIVTLMLLLAAIHSPGFQNPNPGNPSTIEDFKAGDVNREPFQNPAGILTALGIANGDWVADVGAGAGYYSMRLADLAGPKGKVFAEDVSASSIRWLNARVAAFHLTNVEILKGEADDSKLPADRLAAVLVVDSYHHFSNDQAMLNKIFHALKPGGRLAIADYSFRNHRSQPRADQLKQHEIDPDVVRAECEAAGFKFVRCEDPFVKWTPGNGNPRGSAADLWLMVLIRPE